MDALKQYLTNVKPLGLKGILQFLVGEEQAVQLLQQNCLRVTSNVWPPLVKLLETSLVVVEHHLFFQSPENKTASVGY